VAVGVLAIGLPGGASVATVRASTDAAAANSWYVGQFEFPPPLVVRGDKVEVGYDAQYSLNAQKLPNATGTLYVRNDRQHAYTAVPLERRKAMGSFPTGGIAPPTARKLRAFVPQRLLNGHQLFYYAVIRDRASGRVVKVPGRGARAPESVWIVNDAVREKLGTHLFGRLPKPEAIVAKAGPTDVGFQVCPPEGGECGIPHGPVSFELAKDGSIWMHDQENGRLLVWEPGHPNAIARTVPIPPSLLPTGGHWDIADFALGPAGSIYFVRDIKRSGKPDPPLHEGQFPPRGHFPPMRLARASASGNVLWRSYLDTDIYNTQLRIGPDGTLWVRATSATGKDGPDWNAWAPAATPAGRPLSPAQQEARIRWTQSVPDGRQIVLARAGWTGLPWTPNAHEQRVAVIDQAGRVVRAWRIQSRTILDPPDPAVTPRLVGGDPVVTLFPTRVSGGAYQHEYLVLRLAAKGIRARLPLPYGDAPLSAYEDWTISGIRIQPNGKVYQLGSAPNFGAAIYRYSLTNSPP
jgi:hypothetical protein